jgi:hypothetical protein
VHRLRGLHGVPGWDSGALVDPFMRAGTLGGLGRAQPIPGKAFGYLSLGRSPIKDKFKALGICVGS